MIQLPDDLRPYAYLNSRLLFRYLRLFYLLTIPDDRIWRIWSLSPLLERLLLILNLDASASFRMFPPSNIIPDYAEPAYAFPLLAAVHIPFFVSLDRRLDRRATLGTVLRPLIKRASPSVVSFTMFARVWLVVVHKCGNSPVRDRLSSLGLC